MVHAAPRRWSRCSRPGNLAMPGLPDPEKGASATPADMAVLDATAVKAEAFRSCVCASRACAASICRTGFVLELAGRQWMCCAVASLRRAWQYRLYVPRLARPTLDQFLGDAGTSEKMSGSGKRRCIQFTQYRRCGNARGVLPNAA